MKFHITFLSIISSIFSVTFVMSILNAFDHPMPLFGKIIFALGAFIFFSLAFLEEERRERKTQLKIEILRKAVLALMDKTNSKQ